MKTRRNYGRGRRAAVLLAAALLMMWPATSCTELEEPDGIVGGATLTKTYTIASDTGGDAVATRVAVDLVTGDFNWNNSPSDKDTISYIAIPVSSAYGVKTSDVTVTGKTTSVTVGYNSSDTHVLMMHKGSKIGNTSGTPTASAWTVADAVPDKQDGVINSTLLSMGNAGMGDDRVELKLLQTYISFSLSDLQVGGETIKYVTIRSESGSDAEDGSDQDIAAGSVTYNPSAQKYTSHTSGKKLITLDAALSATATYYIAVLPLNYTKGLRFYMKNADKKIISWATTGPLDLSPAGGKTGHVIPVGPVNTHKRVLPTQMKIEPESVHIVNLPSQCQTKRLYLKAVPADLNNIGWKSSDSGVATVAPAEDWIDPDGGTRYLTAIVTPVAEPAWNEEKVCTITAYSKLLAEGSRVDTKTLATRKVYVGRFVDLGLDDGLLWCACNVAGGADITGGRGSETVGTLHLTDDTSDFGDYYQWGWTTPRRIGELKNASAYAARWGAGFDKADNVGGTISLTGSSPYKNTSPSFLEAADDVAKVMTGSLGATLKMEIPSQTQWETLKTVFPPDAVNINGKVCKHFLSSKKFYDDVELFIPIAGCVMLWGDQCAVAVDLCLTVNSATNRPITESVYDRNLYCAVNADGTGGVNWATTYHGNGVSRPLPIMTSFNHSVREAYSVRPVKNKSVYPAD